MLGLDHSYINTSVPSMNGENYYILMTHVDHCFSTLILRSYTSTRISVTKALFRMNSTKIRLINSIQLTLTEAVQYEMRKALILILMLMALNMFGQKNPTEEALPIVAEGKLLYQSEMASWYGTDLFLDNFKDRDKIGGYFSYSEGDSTKCVFFSNDDWPKVLGTISFDSSYHVENANTNLTKRDFTAAENDLYQIRRVALTQLQSNEDEFFVFYQNTSPNIIPLISGDVRKVYVLTGPQQSGVVIFGNDYLLTFDENNKLLDKRPLHKNIIPMEYGDVEKGMEVEGAMHSHLPETGDFITPTDICTLMLYAKFANWKTYNVVSEKYLNTWNCETETLTVIPMEVIRKINEHGNEGKKNR